MKRAIFIFCVFMFFITVGCSNGTRQVSEPLKADEIIVYDILNKPESEQAVEYLDFLDTEMEVKLIPETWDRRTPIEDLGNLFKFNPITYKMLFNERHRLFLPLTDILASNIYTSDLPAGIINALADDDGVVWGFLSSHNFITFSRAYNQNIMDQLGLEIPNTSEDLFDVLRTVKNAADIDVIRITTDFCPESFYDIFACFQSQLIDSKYSIGWNDEKHMYMDCVFTDEMLGSLQFIKEMNEAGLITEVMGKSNLISNAYETDKVFTAVFFNDSGINEKYMSSKLAGSNFVIESMPNHSVYAVPAGTKDADNKVSKFIDTFFGDEKINKTAHWGIEGTHHTYVSPEMINVNNFKNYYSPRIGSWWLENHYSVIRSESVRPDYEEWNKNYWPEIKGNFYDGVYMIVPIHKTIENYSRTTDNTDIHSLFGKVLYQFITEDLSVDQFFEIYKKESKILGIDEYIESLNVKK